MNKFKVGDKVRHVSELSGTTYTVYRVVGDYIYFMEMGAPYHEKYFELVSRVIEGKLTTTKPDGGPSDYYDFPFYEWTTVNDMVEYLSNKQWGAKSWIFKDLLKAITRWGVKEGTDEKYDAKKIIYYGARLLMSVAGKKVTRDYLQQLLDDRQFQLEEKTVSTYASDNKLMKDLKKRDYR